MNAIIFGASGMIGRGVLLECLDHPEVQKVLSIGRSMIDIDHPKLEQLVHHDFTDFSGVKERLQEYDACFFCLGISAAGLSEAEYRRVTLDFAVAAAKTLYEVNPAMTFIYVSGQGTDSSETSSLMWARVKGKTENTILSMGFRNAMAFRPGVIAPLRGIRSRTALYQGLYDYFGWMIPLLKRIAPNSITDTTKIGLAMINAHLRGTNKRVLGPRDINQLAAE